jgi:hypothetical protein
MTTRKSWGAIRRLPSKRFQASYVGPDTHRYLAPDTFKTKSEASTWLAQMRTAIADGKWEPVVQREANSEIVPNFKEFALRHISLQTNRRGELLRESTKSVYRRTLITHLKSFHSKPINLVSKAKIQEWYADLVATGKRTTASKAYKLLSAVMKRAADDGYISANPCSIRGAHSATTGKTVSIPTSAEVVSIANAIKPEFRNLVMLAAYGGFRFGRLVLHKGITCLDI